MYLSVLDTPFFRGLIEEKDREWVESLFVERRYPKGQILFFQGDESHEMYIVKSGTLKIYLQRDEHEIILGHQFPGEVIGELEVFHYDNRRTASVAAIEPAELWMIRRSDLMELTQQYPEIMRKIIYILSERLLQANRKLEYLAFLDMRVRVANLLLDLVINLGVSTEDGLLINWRITQQHMAGMIGAGREATAKVLQELRDDGIIKIRNRHIYIQNLQALQDIASVRNEHDANRKWHSTFKYDISAV